MKRSWTETELDIIETLTRRVQLLAASQIAAVWWPQIRTPAKVRHRLARLQTAGLCQRTIVNAHSLLAPRAPLAIWRPDREPPDFVRVEHCTRERWTGMREPMEVYWASRQAANLFGTTSRELPDLFHRDHDLLLADVYVFYRRNRPRLARRWLGESVFPKAGYRLKDPDAFVFGDDGRPTRIVESAGHYGRDQISAFHDHCAEYDLPYELW